MPGIIVGIDGSGHSHQALIRAMKEAVAHRAPLTVLTVHQAVMGFGGGPVNNPGDQVQAEHAREAAQVLSHGVSLLAEEFVPFERELAVLIARSPSGHGAAYPVVETVQRDGICHEVLAPAPGLPDDLAEEAISLGLELARALDVIGLLAVELFQTSGGLLVNELAMRPYNSGHWTIEGARTSQFEQHLRAVLNWPLGAPTATAPCVVMANVLGGDDPDLHGKLNHVLAADPAVKVQLYGKPVRPGRKVGHVTALGSDFAVVRERARRAARYLATGTEDA